MNCLYHVSHPFAFRHVTSYQICRLSRSTVCATVRLHAMSRLPSISPIASTPGRLQLMTLIYLNFSKFVATSKVSPIEVTRLPAAVDRCELYQVCNLPCATIYRLNDFAFLNRHIRAAHENGYGVQPSLRTGSSASRRADAGYEC